MWGGPGERSLSQGLQQAPIGRIDDQYAAADKAQQNELSIGAALHGCEGIAGGDLGEVPLGHIVARSVKDLDAFVLVPGRVLIAVGYIDQAVGADRQVLRVKSAKLAVAGSLLTPLGEQFTLGRENQDRVV